MKPVMISQGHDDHSADERGIFLTSSGVEVNTEPLTGPLKSLGPVKVETVSQTCFEPLWDHLVKEHHYLSYQKLLGRRLKYLAFLGERPAAALSFSAPALKLRARDRFIGWSDEQRKAFLDRMVNNSRFLIMPWVQVSCLASQVLSLAVKRLPEDWEQRFHTPLWIVETFVDPSRFKATSYRAANWQFAGYTYGSAKQGPGYTYHGSIKEVYLYVLDPRFREHIGCRQQPYCPAIGPSHQKKWEGQHMMIQGWHPGQVPCVDLTEEDVEAMANELVAFHQMFLDCYGRVEHHRLGEAYLSGLMSNLNAKSAEPIALGLLGVKGVRPLQRFMKSYLWDDRDMEAKHQALLSDAISCPGGMITIDSSEFLKKGKESVGVYRQYCGRYGKVENCQSGVFIGYASDKGYGLLSARLYMPNIWFSKSYEQRRKDTLAPEDLTFKTKQEIALELIHNIAKTGLFTSQWLGCDATFGADSEFLQSLPEGLCYFANIRSNMRVFLQKPQVGIPPYKGKGRKSQKIQVLPGEPESQTVAEIAASNHGAWESCILAEGAKGPVVAEVCRLRVFPSKNGLPQDNPVWLFMRRMGDCQIKYAFSSAPEEIPMSEMCKAATMRWSIEQCFEDGKSHMGMAQYEHRSWPAWHRHMLFVCLGLHFLLRVRTTYKKNACADLAPGLHPAGGSIAPALSE